MTQPTENTGRSGKGGFVRTPFRWLDSGLNVVERYVLIVGILVMALVSVINVFARNLGHSLSFADELAQVLVVVVTFVGVGHGVRNARHIRVSALHDVLPPLGQKILLTIVSFFSCALLGLLTVYAWDYVMKLHETGRVLPSLQFPLWIAYMIAPIGLAVGCAQFFLAGVRNLISPGAWLSWHHPDEYEDELEQIASEAGLADDLMDYSREQADQAAAGGDSDKQSDKQKGAPDNG